MPDQVWVQYGCFGIVALLTAWALFKGIPSALAEHQAVVKSLVDAFTAESAECRSERQATQAAAAAEREADRQARNDLAAAVQKFFADAGDHPRRPHDPTGGHS